MFHQRHKNHFANINHTINLQKGENLLIQGNRI